MVKNFVVDTNALICYFNQVFGASGLRLSNKAHSIIQNAFIESSSIRLTIPSIIFVEIFEKWYKNDEFAAEFRYNVFEVIKEAPNIEIRSMDREVLENLMLIRGTLKNHDIHDKIILASAMALNCPLITFDSAVIKYIEKSTVISFLN